MVTIKKRGPNLSSFVLISALSIFLTACGPAGPRNVIKGEKLLRNGDYQGAVEKLEAATRQLAQDPAPVQAQAWNFLGLAYQNVGQPAPALKAYQQALRLDRNLVEADYNMGVLQLEQKNYPAAVDLLVTYVTLRPNDPEGFTKLGTAHLHWSTKIGGVEKQRRLDNAKKCFESARTLHPSAEIDNALGVVHLQRNRPLDAEKQFNSALQLDPNYGPAILNLAIVAHQYQHDHRLALQKYREYLALKPTPDNASEIEPVVKSLEREFAPPVVATPAPKPVAAAPTPVVAANPTPTQTPKPAPTQVASAPVKTNSPTVSAPVQKGGAPVAFQSPRQQADTTAKPTTTAAITKPTAPQNSTAAVTSAPLEVAQVSDTASPKVAQDVPAPAIPQPALPSVTAPRAVALPPLEPKTEKKNSILKKLNPVSWFGKKSKTKEAPEPAPEVIKETPLPEPKPVVASAPAVVTPLPAKPAVAPAIARYKYSSPAKPTAGNAQSAAQFVAQGSAARRQSHFSDAILAYRNALISDPANFDAAYLLAVTEQEVYDYPASLPFFEQALVINPQSTDARYAFAWSLQKAKYPQDAADELEKLLQQTPNDPKANLLLATLYAQSLNQPKLARDHYLRVLQADPHNSQATAIRFWLAANP
ncbi:MAG: tetratricopeptide repeat protein [Limisphaerales bacterium]